VYQCGNISLDIGDNRLSPFYAVLVEAADLHARKNANYAGDGDDPFKNFRECWDFNIPAWKGILIRLSDKWSRIKNLAKGIEDKVGEAIDDTLMDNGVYSFIAVCMLRETTDDANSNVKTEDVRSDTG